MRAGDSFADPRHSLADLELHSDALRRFGPRLPSLAPRWALVDLEQGTYAARILGPCRGRRVACRVARGSVDLTVAYVHVIGEAERRWISVDRIIEAREEAVSVAAEE